MDGRYKVNSNGAMAPISGASAAGRRCGVWHLHAGASVNLGKAARAEASTLSCASPLLEKGLCLRNYVFCFYDHILGLFLRFAIYLFIQYTEGVPKH